MVLSSENSQHIADWYTFSHILHGFLFYGATWLVLPKRAMARAPDRSRSLVEGAWELVENSDWIIDRYRTGTVVAGLFRRQHRQFGLRHAGDDRGLPAGEEASGGGHGRARRSLFELVMLLHIRDNLALNIIMLIHPVEAIKQWQAGPPII